MDVIVLGGALGVVGACLVLWWAVTARPSPARANLLNGLRAETTTATRNAAVLDRLGRRGRRFVPASLLGRLERNLVQAGHPSGFTLPRIVGLKFTLAGLGVAGGLGMGAPLIAAGAGALLFFLPDYWVLSVRDERQASMAKQLPDVVDQLAICVEAGLGFDAALTRVASSGEGPLIDELRRALSDIRAGVPRSQALRTLANRAQLPDIRQLVTALLQAQKHGVSIGETLRVQSAEIRLKRRQRTEEKAAKLAVKMLFPIVFCFLPVFIIVSIVPAILELMDQF